MLAITPQHRFFIAIEPVDFRMRISVGTNTDSGLQANTDSGFTRTLISVFGERLSQLTEHIIH